MTKICIFGAGSIGGFIATSLKKTNAQVSLIARGEHKKAIEQNGLTFIRDDNKINFKFDVTDNPKDLDEQDFIIISVKANACLLYTSPSPRDRQKSRMPSSA